MARGQGTIAGLLAAVALLPGLNPIVTTSPAAAGEDQAPAIDDATAAPTRITATVLRPDGTPVEGAVAVTSAGGQGVTDAGGVAVLEVAVDGSVQELSLTGAAVVDGVNLLGNLRLGDIRRDGATSAGPIVLQSNAGCQPEWLPTFGGEPGVNGDVRALAVFDDGTGGGPALYAGGGFTSAGDVAANFVAQWDGLSWSALASGVNGHVRALRVFDDRRGGGPALYAGGGFTVSPAGDSYLARWQGCFSCPWDLDGDSAVGINDFLMLLVLWGTYPGGPPDFDGDGVVGSTDFQALLGAWGPCT